MERIATTGLKTDLHIHSQLSSHKDGKKVNQNTYDNIGTLIQKLIESEVNICSITDHDAFDYDLYLKLKLEEQKENCIMKVLPGVEFSVLFENGDNCKEIHIVTIFDDSNSDNIKKIGDILSMKGSKPNYDKDNAFSEEKYVSILKEIGINVVMIAHQKNSLMSTSKSKKNDALSLGHDAFNEFLFTEYFEAYEFRNKRNELFNKKYIFDNNADHTLRMITGSDCHEWSVYPKEDATSNSDFVFTYFKCIPSFKGVVMAITDYRRIKMANSFFNPASNSLDAINFLIDGKEHIIPLSKGINVIIGDNSVGKSLVLHAITNYQKAPSTSVKKGYEKYLKEAKTIISSQLDETDIFRFDTQGEVRKLFEEGTFKASDFLKPYFPNDIDPKPYRRIVDEAFKEYYDLVQASFDYESIKSQLPKFKLLYNETTSQSITFIDSIKTVNDKKMLELLEDFQSAVDIVSRLKKSSLLDPDDIVEISNMFSEIEKIQKKYNEKHITMVNQNKLMNVVRACINSFKKKYSRQITDEQKVLSSYYEDISDAANGIVEAIRKKRDVQDHKFSINTQKIEPRKSAVNQYAFISKLGIEEISNEYIENVLTGALKKNKKIHTKSITLAELKNIISYFPEEAPSPLDALKAKISEQLDKDFAIKHSIIQNDMDVYKELSSGFNSQIYFALISGETHNRNIYIIDQPEDHVSPKAINSFLLEQFKDMGEHRQIIMVTHNPQFIVNLDVDNVIFLSREDKHPLQVFSGALEYEDAEYSILKIIAENIEGGLDTVSRRMKRYEKAI